MRCCCGCRCKLPSIGRASARQTTGANFDHVWGGRLLSEANELCGGDADNMDSTTDSFMRFLKTLPFASYCDIKCTRDRLRQCAIGTHINVASPCLPRVCEINDYHCNCNQNSKCLMSQHVSKKMTELHEYDFLLLLR